MTHPAPPTPPTDWEPPCEGDLIARDSDTGRPNAAALYLANLTPGSRRTMREALNTVAALLGVAEVRTTDGQDVRCLHTPWGAVRYAHTIALRATLVERYAPATANKILAALRRVLQEAFRLGELPAEEYQRAVLVPTVKGHREPTGRVITPSEVRALLRACADDPSPLGRRDAAVLALIRGTGLRRAEVAALNLEAYHRETGELLVRGGKGNKDRRVWAPSGTRAALEVWLGVRGTHPGAMFIRAYKGGRFSTQRITAEAVALILTNRAQEAGIPACTPHDMRRTYISELLDAGIDLATVQQLVGHAQVTTTASYDRRGEAAKRKAVEFVEVPFFAPAE
ncbi:tyrosine-type recombinase/integrase [Candidatus Chloroploca asiatica]|uniref:tyrosine-type recombinase/integrase n=1 Tax=Candidatus Chloroploca asiatica TaxID=1506545 RepID=UPI000BE8335D|nr:tyrosine-type recombinase/integrase [Candidatus Chloroploca asiatica]